MLLTGQLLDQCKHLIEEGVHPHAIIRAFRRSTQLAIEKINEIAIKVSVFVIILFVFTGVTLSDWPVFYQILDILLCLHSH